MQFANAEEAMQFLADQITHLSARVTKLENQSLAHMSALHGLVACVGQLPPMSVEMVTGLLKSHADALERKAEETGEDVERCREIAAYLRDIGFSDKPRPIFDVITGGKAVDD